jgi:hypothetical protein
MCGHLLYKPEVKIIVISRSIGRSKTFFPEKNTEPNHFLEEKIIINTLRLILTNKISLIFRTVIGACVWGGG